MLDFIESCIYIYWSLQISAAENSAWLCHSQAAQTFLPAGEGLQTCPPTSPLVQGRVAKNAHSSATSIMVNWKVYLTHMAKNIWLSKPSHEWIPPSLFCEFSFPFKEKKKKKENFILKLSQVLQALSFGEPVNSCVVEAAFCSAPFHKKSSWEGSDSRPGSDEITGCQSRLSGPLHSLTSMHADIESPSHSDRWAFLLHETYKTRSIARESRCFICAQIALTFLSVKI